jgi:hypothetical protein
MADLIVNRALELIEIAALRVRDNHWAQKDHEGSLIGNAFDEFAGLIAEVAREEGEKG